MLVVPGTLEHYSQLNIVEEVMTAGIEPKKIHIHNKKEKTEISLENVRSLISRYPRLLTYPQDQHERLLIDVLQKRGHHIQWETTFLDLNQNESEVTARMEQDNQTVSRTFRYVVGADGGSSAVRKALEIELEGDTNAKRFFVADVELNNETLVDAGVHFFFLYEDFLLCFPLRDQTTKRLIGVIPESVAQKETVQMKDLIPIFNDDYQLTVTETKWFSEYKVHHRLAESYQKDRVFLAGDAAHLHSPIGGQGMNAGIADAINLGWKLAHVLQNKAHPTLLDTYEEERIMLKN